MITLKELARLCNTSPSTVSNILNGRNNVSDKTRARVLEMIEKTGYKRNYFASSIRRSESNIIAIIAEDLFQFSTPPMAEAIMAACEKNHYRTVLMNMRMYDRWKDTWYSDERKIEEVFRPILQEVESIHVNGVIYVAGHDRPVHCFPKDFRTPAVFAYAYPADYRFPSILMDDEKGGYDMGHYLLSMGHQKIGVITGAPGNLHMIYRLKGYQKALFEAGIPYNPAWTRAGNWEMESGYAHTKELLDAGVTAIWAMNDQMAGGVYQYLDEQGLRAGRDIAVAGYDNMVISGYFVPKLTTVELPLMEIGRRAAETMVEMLRAQDKQATGAQVGADMETPHYEPVLVPSPMIIRDSVNRLG
jgi:LacI family transcriptional regulator